MGFLTLRTFGLLAGHLLLHRLGTMRLAGLSCLRPPCWALEDSTAVTAIACCRILTENENDSFSALPWLLGKRTLSRQRCSCSFLCWVAVVDSGRSLHPLARSRAGVRGHDPRYLVVPFKIHQLAALALLVINAEGAALS